MHLFYFNIYDTAKNINKRNDLSYNNLSHFINEVKSIMTQHWSQKEKSKLEVNDVRGQWLSYKEVTFLTSFRFGND